MRQSPLLIAYKGISILRNAIFFYIVLFIVKKDSTASVFEYGRAAFWFIISFSVIYVIASWWRTTFTLDSQQLTKRSGVIIRETQQVPIAQLEQVTVNKHWFHRLTNTSACSYQLADANEVLTIDMMSEQQMEQLLLKESEPSVQGDIIFQPTRKQLVKASFTSLRFLLAIPFLISVYSRVDHFINLEAHTVTFVENVKSHTSWLVVTIALYIAVSVLCALVFTFIKFGRDKVVKEGSQLTIRKGLIHESKVTLDIAHITGVELRQSLLKRMVGLAEIRLQFKSKDANELQSVYPYFEYEQALAFIDTYFPQFTVHGTQQKLTKASLIPKLGRATMLIAVIWLAGFLSQSWLPIAYYWLAAALTVIVLLGVLLAYQQFTFVMQDEQLQLRHGIFGSSVTTIHLHNVCDIHVEQSMLQRLLGLQTMSLSAYSDKLADYRLKDVRVERLQALQQSYVQLRKRKRISIEN